MDLQGMSPAGVLELLETSMGACVGNWNSDYGVSLRAELKRRCEAWTEFQNTLPIGGRPSYLYPACPCPAVHHYAVGDKGGPEPDKTAAQIWPTRCYCPKCGNFKAWEKECEGPCEKCQASRPPAPSGYEFVGEWRLVEEGEWYLGVGRWAGREIRYEGKAWATDPSVDGGKRWILRKVEEPCYCPKCGRCQGPGWRFESPAANPCVVCVAARPPAKPGYEYTEEWREPLFSDWFLTCDGKLGPARKRIHIDRTIDAGRRWILRKVAEPLAEPEICCRACGHRCVKESFYPALHYPNDIACPICLSIDNQHNDEYHKYIAGIVARVEKLEKQDG